MFKRVKFSLKRKISSFMISEILNATVSKGKLRIKKFHQTSARPFSNTTISVKEEFIMKQRSNALSTKRRKLKLQNAQK